ncbi:MAG: MBL fold metallo-hydrolase, partial [Campylobacteraceae bacterium]|nr:MBL fold metallo-hydrolase [Campylobacteraceae bacterium]
AKSEELKATIIGSGSPIYNENRSGPSVLITQGNTSILVDMGNGTQANLNKAHINVRNLSALFFTHHHLDHNEELVPMFIRSILGRNSFSIIGPPNTQKLVSTNFELYKEDISYRLSKSKRSLASRASSYTAKDIIGGESFYINNIKISTQKVPHSIYAIAYRFEYNNKSIVITGDLTYSKDLAQFSEKADYLIIDAGGMVMQNKKRKNGSRSMNNSSQKKKRKSARIRAHLNLADSSLIAKNAQIKNLVYTHFRSGNINKEESLKEITKNYTGKVIFAEDLMQLD